MNERKLTHRQRMRRIAMVRAFLSYHSRALVVWDRETDCWWFLLLWASLGGTPDEVIR